MRNTLLSELLNSIGLMCGQMDGAVHMILASVDPMTVLQGATLTLLMFDMTTIDILVSEVVLGPGMIRIDID